MLTDLAFYLAIVMGRKGGKGGGWKNRGKGGKGKGGKGKGRDRDEREDDRGDNKRRRDANGMYMIIYLESGYFSPHS